MPRMRHISTRPIACLPQVTPREPPAAIADHNPRESGAECENLSQLRFLAIEATIQLCPHQARAIMNRRFPGVAQIVTPAPGAPRTLHSRPPFMIAKDLQSA
jgi:hypothetical protein